MNPNNTVIGVGCDVLFGILSVSDEDVDAIESSVGMGCGAWDQVAPKEIIAAAWNRLRLPRDFRHTPESDAVIRNAYSWEEDDSVVKYKIMARKIRSLERERNQAIRERDDALDCQNCGGLGMILGAAADDDVMNAPCPKCNVLPNVAVDLPDTAAQDSASKTNNPAVSG